MKHTLILIRHAHRDKNKGSQIDNGLSDMGKQQASRVRDHWKNLKGNIRIESSPKLRCQETVKPLAHALKLPVQVDLLLDEQSGSESFAALKKRVGKYVQEWENSEPHTRIACSHGDWIPIAVQILVEMDFPIELAEWIVIDYDGAIATLAPQ